MMGDDRGQIQVGNRSLDEFDSFEKHAMGSFTRDDQRD